MNETYHKLFHGIKKSICKHLAIPDVDLDINTIYDPSDDSIRVIVKFKKIRKEDYMLRMRRLRRAIEAVHESLEDERKSLNP
jgi:hypothetical protein